MGSVALSGTQVHPRSSAQVQRDLGAHCGYSKNHVVATVTSATEAASSVGR